VKRRSKVLLVVAVVGVIAIAMVVRSCNYTRFESACTGIETGSSLDDARERLVAAGGKWVAFVQNEHQWIRVRWSFTHQNCGVTVDSKNRVVSVRHSDVWDLL
jgi:hypothetical protein